MRYYKSACEFDETRVQDAYSVIGSEFIDFLSTLLTFRLLMSILARAKKACVGNENWKLEWQNQRENPIAK